MFNFKTLHELMSQKNTLVLPKVLKAGNRNYICLVLRQMGTEYHFPPGYPDWGDHEPCLFGKADDWEFWLPYKMKSRTLSIDIEYKTGWAEGKSTCKTHVRIDHTTILDFFCFMFILYEFVVWICSFVWHSCPKKKKRKREKRHCSGLFFQPWALKTAYQVL